MTTLTAPVSWEVRDTAEKPLLHLWGERCNLTRRVIAITEQSEEHVGLAENWRRGHRVLLRKWLHPPPCVCLAAISQ